SRVRPARREKRVRFFKRLETGYRSVISNHMPECGGANDTPASNATGVFQRQFSLALSGLRNQLAQHERQDAAVPVVINLNRGIDSQQHAHLLPAAVSALDQQRDILLRLDVAVDSKHVDFLVTIDSERLCGVSA